jgi:hypothetical protein
MFFFSLDQIATAYPGENPEGANPALKRQKRILDALCV